MTLILSRIAVLVSREHECDTISKRTNDRVSDVCVEQLLLALLLRLLQKV